MGIIQHVQKKSREEKIRIIWIISIVCLAALVALWVITSKLRGHLPKDTSLFQTVNRGIKDLKDNYKK